MPSLLPLVDLLDHASENNDPSVVIIDEIDNHDDIDYNPYHKEGTASFFKTCFNGLNALSGVGLLSIPYALSSGGWLSLILLFIVAASTCFTGMLIRRCMDLDPQIRTYPDIGGRAFGNIGRGLVSIFTYSELYLVATGFLILEGDNLHDLFFNVRFDYSWINISGRVGFVIIVALIILPSVWLRDLSILSYVSAIGFLACVVLLGSVIWTGATDGYHEKGRTLNLSRLSTAFSLYTFCYSAHPVFPTLYTSMRDKSQFNKVLLFCYAICTTGYTLMAIFGYLMYGEHVNSQVTLNLPVKKFSSKIAIYTTLDLLDELEYGPEPLYVNFLVKVTSATKASLEMEGPGIFCY
ncbi:Amino acid transporter [Thalictrum thalictroides]|uniref:Amino acid transporter n=1 Tax=Thalictrum thalictroides TaxID=46969 RepID=A0A7J6V9K8_THATH|nr:Amino acid transporter [Thalictrum thalictroides]